MSTKILGVGNILLSDDGVGIRLVQRLLDAYRFSPHVDIIDGGTIGPRLAAYLSGTVRLLVMDAVATGAAPGSVVVLRGESIRTRPRVTLSGHDASLSELFARLALLDEMPDEVVVIGIEPDSLAPDARLSAPVEAALAHAERAVIAQLREWGVEANAF